MRASEMAAQCGPTRLHWRRAAPRCPSVSHRCGTTRCAMTVLTCPHWRTKRADATAGPSRSLCNPQASSNTTLAEPKILRTVEAPNAPCKNTHEYTGIPTTIQVPLLGTGTYHNYRQARAHWSNMPPQYEYRRTRTSLILRTWFIEQYFYMCAWFSTMYN